jgi:hypothetical protein
VCVFEDEEGRGGVLCRPNGAFKFQYSIVYANSVTIDHPEAEVRERERWRKAKRFVEETDGMLQYPLFGCLPAVYSFGHSHSSPDGRFILHAVYTHIKAMFLAGHDMTEAMRVLYQRLAKLEESRDVRWGEWLTYEEVKNRALDWDTLFAVGGAMRKLLDRVISYEHHDIHPNARVDDVLDRIQFSEEDRMLLFYVHGARFPSRRWTLAQVDQGILVVEQLADGEEQTTDGETTTLATVSDWCRFMNTVRPPIRYVGGGGAKEALSLGDVCCWLMEAHFSGRDWSQVARVPLQWERLVEFFERMPLLVVGLEWFFKRKPKKRTAFSAADDPRERPTGFSVADVSLIQKHLAKYVFKTDSRRTGQFSYIRHNTPVVWNLSSGGVAFILACRESTNQTAELATVQDLRVFLSQAYIDVYFTPDGVNGKMMAASELVDSLMQQFRWWRRV